MSDPHHAMPRRSARRNRRVCTALLALAAASSAGLHAQQIDTGFTPSFNDTVRAIAVAADGRILVGGQFSSAGGQPIYGLARLGANGSIETGIAAPNDRVNEIVVQGDGRIVIAGEFDRVNGAAHPYVARLLPSGALDPTFVSQVGLTTLGVTRLGVQADGRVVVAGLFNAVSGQPRGRIARLLANGAVDPSFTPPPLGSAPDAMGLRSARALVLTLDPGDTSGTGAVSFDLSDGKLFAPYISKASHFSSDRTFGPYRGHHVSIPFVGKFDYVFDDHTAIGTMGEGIMDRIAAGTPAAPPPVFSLALAPAGMPKDTWVWLFDQLGVPSPQRLVERLSSWQEAHVTATIDGSQLLVEVAGTHR